MGVAVGETDGDGFGVGVGVGETEGDGFGVGVGVGEAEGDGLGVGETEGVGVGEGLGRRRRRRCSSCWTVPWPGALGRAVASPVIAGRPWTGAGDSATHARARLAID